MSVRYLKSAEPRSYEQELSIRDRVTEMLREIASAPNVARIDPGEPPGWIRGASQTPLAHRLAEPSCLAHDHELGSSSGCSAR